MASSTRRDPDALIRILDRQLNLITRQQALTVGLTRHALGHRLGAGGPWRTLLPGVYIALTGTPTTLQQEMAAMLYAGSGSVITGPAALRCHHIRGTSSDLVDILVPATRKRRDAGFVRLHRTTRMPERSWQAGPLRYAPPPRAVADAVRDMTSLRDVRAVVADAVQRGRCGVPDLYAELIAGSSVGSALFREDHAKTLARGRRMGVYQIVALRFTPKQIRSEPAEVIDEIRRTIEGARGRPPLNLRTVPVGAGQLVKGAV